MVLLVAFELLSFAFTRLRPDLFDEPGRFLAGLTAAELERGVATTASHVLGWDNPTSTTVRAPNCQGNEVAYTYGNERNRVHAETPPRDAVILVAGDSYTHGNDVSDDQTYPAQLERLLGQPVANLGVSGYGPDQALLKLENEISLFPRAEVVVLSILYDDTARMLNSFRPLLQRPTGRHLGLKPFVENGSFHAIIGGEPYRDLASFKAAVLSAFEHDYWRRPRAAFPYMFSVARMMVLPSFWMSVLTQAGEAAGVPHYEILHRIPRVRRDLNALYERFMTWTKERGLKGIVVFIPVDDKDQTSGTIAIAAASEAQRRALIFHNVTYGGPFHIEPGCHPFAAGYRIIADDVSKVVRPAISKGH